MVENSNTNFNAEDSKNLKDLMKKRYEESKEVKTKERITNVVFYVGENKTLTVK